MRKWALVIAAGMIPMGCALAAEETTVTHRDPVPPVLGTVVGKPLGDSGSTTVTTKETGCSSTTVHKENSAGGSRTVNQTNC